MSIGTIDSEGKVVITHPDVNLADMIAKAEEICKAEGKESSDCIQEVHKLYNTDFSTEEEEQSEEEESEDTLPTVEIVKSNPDDIKPDSELTKG